MDWSTINEPHSLPSHLGISMPYLEQAMPFYNVLIIILTPLGSFGILLYGLLTWIILPLTVYYLTLALWNKSGKYIALFIKEIKEKKVIKGRLVFHSLLFLVMGCGVGYYGGLYTIMPLLEIIFALAGK